MAYPDNQKHGWVPVLLIMLCGLGFGFALGETSFPFTGKDWIPLMFLFTFFTLAFATMDIPGFMSFVVAELLGFVIHPWASAGAGLLGISTIILASLYAPIIIRQIRPYLSVYYNY